MFTMKKFAILAAVGFMAFSVVSCSDDKDDEGNKSTPISDKWDKTAVIELGGSSNATLGSFLDIDEFKVYKKAEVAANSAKIDLVFDGSNFLTPEGCETSTFCKDLLSDNEAGLVDVSGVSAIKATSLPTDIQDWVDSHLTDNGPDALLSGLIVSKVAAKKGGKYLALTNADNLALVVVNDDLTTASVTLSIGRIALPE